MYLGLRAVAHATPPRATGAEAAAALRRRFFILRQNLRQVEAKPEAKVVPTVEAKVETVAATEEVIQPTIVEKPKPAPVEAAKAPSPTKEPSPVPVATKAPEPVVEAAPAVVEEAIEAAERQQDFEPFNKLVDILDRPFKFDQSMSRYALPPRPEQVVTQTFCGT